MKHIQENIAFQLSGLISAKLGLNFPKERFRDLENGLNKAKKDFDFDDLVQFVDWLLGTELSSAQIELLASHFTIGETYFFRDMKYFNAIEKIIKDDIIQKIPVKDKRLRIWSAGCSTGEEAYSVAIMLDRIIHNINDWNITIMATDINTKSLKKARDGVYKDWSFRNSPDWLNPNYFNETSKGCFQINQSIKDIVTFQYHNLALDPYPSLVHNLFAFDIIFCRNVMMYFTQDLMTKAIGKFFHSLNDTGFFIVSPSEASHLLFSAFDTLYYPDVILYKKINSEYIPDKYNLIQKEKYYHVEKQTEDIVFTPIRKKSKKLNNIPKTISTVTGEQSKSYEFPYLEKKESIEQAETFFNRGRYDDAEKLLKEVLSSDKENFSAMILLAKIYGNRGLPGESLGCCKKAIELDKLNPEPYYLQATILQETGKTVEAVEWLKKALYLDSKFIICHFGLGNLFLKLGKISESKKYFKNASNLIAHYNNEEIIPESAGITAGRLKDIITKLTENN